MVERRGEGAAGLRSARPGDGGQQVHGRGVAQDRRRGDHPARGRGKAVQPLDHDPAYRGGQGQFRRSVGGREAGFASRDRAAGVAFPSRAAGFTSPYRTARVASPSREAGLASPGRAAGFTSLGRAAGFASRHFLRFLRFGARGGARCPASVAALIRTAGASAQHLLDHVRQPARPPVQALGELLRHGPRAEQSGGQFPGLRHRQRREALLGHRDVGRGAQGDREREPVAVLAGGEDESEARRRVGDDRTEEGAGPGVGPLEVLHGQHGVAQVRCHGAQGPQDAMVFGLRFGQGRRRGREPVGEVGQQPAQGPGHRGQVPGQGVEQSGREGAGGRERLDDRGERRGRRSVRRRTAGARGWRLVRRTAADTRRSGFVRRAAAGRARGRARVRLPAAGGQDDAARRGGGGPVEEFPDEPALPHTRLPGDRHDGGSPFEFRTQVVQEPGASDQGAGGGEWWLGVHGVPPHPGRHRHDERPSGCGRAAGTAS